MRALLPTEMEATWSSDIDKLSQVTQYKGLFERLTQTERGERQLSANML